VISVGSCPVGFSVRSYQPVPGEPSRSSCPKPLCSLTGQVRAEPAITAACRVPPRHESRYPLPQAVQASRFGAFSPASSHCVRVLVTVEDAAVEKTPGTAPMPKPHVVRATVPSIAASPVGTAQGQPIHPLLLTLIATRRFAPPGRRRLGSAGAGESTPWFPRVPGPELPPRVQTGSEFHRPVLCRDWPRRTCRTAALAGGEPGHLGHPSGIGAARASGPPG